jgi:hypothetical protein
MTLSNIQALALSKVKVGDEVRGLVRPGSYEVGFSVVVAGSLIVGEDETYVPTTHVPLIPAMALALRRSGFQREGILASLVDAMRETMEGGEEFREALEVDVKEAEKLFRASLAILPRATRAGKVKAKVTAK